MYAVGHTYLKHISFPVRQGSALEKGPCFEVHGACGKDAVYNSFCIFESDGGDWLALRLKCLTPGERAQIHIG